MKKILFLLSLVTAVFQLSAQQKSHNPPHSGRHVKKKSSKPAEKKYPTHYGTASFYANKFEGRRTSNGEIFSQQKFTAASNHIPMNSWVRVTNMRNKRSVILRINDRMHPKNPRLIDLSRSAASRLRYTGRGIVRVKVEVLGKHLPPGIVKD
ncbi:MAG TPA: septal ring lytic transglycosylase RlpA family protein [Puia sp.]